MFNEFEGNADERQTKLDERLAILKRARQDGFFDEKGTEKVEVHAAGINPCDLGISAFTGEQPFLRPKGATAPVLTDENGVALRDQHGKLRRDKRGTAECGRCEGLGSLELMYGDGATLERCPECHGSGRVTAVCFVCGGRGRGLRGRVCTACDELWE